MRKIWCDYCKNEINEVDAIHVDQSRLGYVNYAAGDACQTCLNAILSIIDQEKSRANETMMQRIKALAQLKPLQMTLP